MDARVPTETLYYLMFSAGQAGVAHFMFLVEDAEVSPWSGWPEEPPAGRQVLAAADADGSVRVSLARPRPRPEPRVVPQEGLDQAIEGVLAGETMGCAIQLIEVSQPSGETLAMTDTLWGLGAREVILGRENMDPVDRVPVEAGPPSADTPRRYSDTDTAAVLLTSAPAILPPRMSSSDPATRMDCGPWRDAEVEEEWEEEEAEWEEEEEGPADSYAVTEPPVETTHDRVSSGIKARRSEVMACYSHELTADPALAGQLIVRFDILAGETGGVEVTGMTSALQSCVDRRVRDWSFAGVDKATGIELSYSLEPSEVE